MFRKGSSFPWEQGGKWSTMGFSGGKWAQSPLISPVQILPHLWTSTTSPHPLPFFMQLAAGTSSWAPAAKVIPTLTPASAFLLCTPRGSRTGEIWLHRSEWLGQKCSGVYVLSQGSTQSTSNCNSTLPEDYCPLFLNKGNSIIPIV